MFHELLSLLLNSVLGPQDLAAFDIQEAEGIDITESVKEFFLREGLLGVILWLLEGDASLRERRAPIVCKSHTARKFHVRLGWQPTESEQP